MKRVTIYESSITDGSFTPDPLMQRTRLHLRTIRVKEEAGQYFVCIVSIAGSYGCGMGRPGGERAAIMQQFSF